MSDDRERVVRQIHREWHGGDCGEFPCGLRRAIDHAFDAGYASGLAAGAAAERAIAAQYAWTEGLRYPAGTCERLVGTSIATGLKNGAHLPAPEPTDG